MMFSSRLAVVWWAPEAGGMKAIFLKNVKI